MRDPIPTILGRKKKNPYSVKNMQKAYDLLKLEKADVPKLEIEPTHYYVRFLPKDSADFNTLFEDTSLILFDYPLDYEIVEQGDYYQDPELIDQNTTWQYASVTVAFEFPKEVEYELLEECYIPDEESSESKNKGQKFTEFLGQLEYRSHELTGNTNAYGASEKGRYSSEIPEGYIKVYNTSFGNVGIDGVRVRGHNFVKVAYAWINSTGSGYYKLNKSFRSMVHYSVIFQNIRGFKIWGDYLFTNPAKSHIGKHSKSGYSYTYSKSSQVWLWATINNATIKYHAQCDAINIPRPPSNIRIWSLRTNSGWAGSAPMAHHIGLNVDNLVDFLEIAYFGISTFGITTGLSVLAPDIFILHSGSETSQQVHSTVYHELAHASHYSKVGKGYWLKYVGHVIANGGYGDGTEKNAGYCGVGEMWGNYFGNYVCSKNVYGTSNNYMRGEDWYNPGFLQDVDSISDVTTSEIFNSLSATSINSLVTNLKSKTSYDSQVDYHYATYTDWP